MQGVESVHIFSVHAPRAFDMTMCGGAVCGGQLRVQTKGRMRIHSDLCNVQQGDGDYFHAREELSCHLLCWSWLLQIVLQHEGAKGFLLTPQEALGAGSWLDLICALRVEPNVLYATADVYEPHAPVAGMGTSAATAVEECARLLLLRDWHKTGMSSEALSAVVECFCGEGMVRSATSRMLLYQELLPCSPQGDLLRRTIMTHELRTVLGASRCRLFPPALSLAGNPCEEQSHNSFPGKQAGKQVEVAAAEVFELPTSDVPESVGEWQMEWSGQHLLVLMQQVAVRDSKVVTFAGRDMANPEVHRLLVLLQDCVEDVLPACKVRARRRLAMVA
jgi:hypothetical protein